MTGKETAIKVTSSSETETEELAASIGHVLKGGEAIELSGDVGSGKTTFVRGLARGASSQDLVSSPTFTVGQVYKGKNLKIYHYDFYRLDDLIMIKGELAEKLEDSNDVVVLEWGEEIRGLLPAEHVRIEFKVTGEEGRVLEITIPESYSYLNQGNRK